MTSSGDTDLIAALFVTRPHFDGLLHAVRVDGRVEALRQHLVADLASTTKPKHNEIRPTINTMDIILQVCI